MPTQPTRLPFPLLGAFRRSARPKRAAVESPERRRAVKARRATLSVIGGLALWELSIRVLHPNPLSIVGPIDIGDAFVRLAGDGTLWKDFTVSMHQFGLGFLLATAVAIPLGLVMGASRRAH